MILYPIDPHPIILNPACFPVGWKRCIKS